MQRDIAEAAEPVNMAELRAYPVDEVAPEHEDIHADLETWGRWNRDRRRVRRECGSVEHQHRSTGYRSYNDPMPEDFVVLLAPNPRNLAIDRAVLEVPDGHQQALKLHYVALAPAWLIVRRCAIQAGDFGRWMHDARCMVVNLLRRHGA
jgi:hypothetical protein